MTAQSTTPEPAKRPSTLPEVAPVSWAVMQLAHAQRSMAGQRLTALGLFPGQELVLGQLWIADGCSQKDLLTALGLDHSTIAKSVQRLEKAGLVRRERSLDDGRVTLVHLTDAGRALQEPVQDIWRDLEARWTHLDPEAVRQFAAIAQDMLDRTAPRAGA